MYERLFKSFNCGAVRCVAWLGVWRIVAWRGVAWSGVACGTVRCGAVRCGAVRCGAVRCGAVRCGAVLPLKSAIHVALTLYLVTCLSFVYFTPFLKEDLLG